MTKPIELKELLKRLKEANYNQFTFQPRIKEPNKNPAILFMKLGKTRQEMIDGVLRRLTEEDCTKQNQEDISPGHTGWVWVFKKTFNAITKDEVIAVKIYIKITLDGSQIIVISFHE
ncbi:MAG: type II toxin-antitoxin system MqsR family toxin [Bacilli bacterium]|jgi:hypothetical protein|nr:type II toxin-antitoxin system MqsR family toxin [Bacilli bacterium]